MGSIFRTVKIKLYNCISTYLLGVRVADQQQPLSHHRSQAGDPQLGGAEKNLRCQVLDLGAVRGAQHPGVSTPEGDRASEGELICYF